MLFAFDAVTADKEQCNCARAGMRTDDRTDVVDDLGFDAVFLFDFCRNVFCVVEAVAMGDKDVRIIEALDLCFHFCDESVERRFASADFTDVDELSVFIDVQDRFDAEHRADKRSCSGNTAAAIQVVQIVNGEIVADILFDRFGVCRERFNVQFVFRIAQDEVNEQTFAKRSRKRITMKMRRLGYFSKSSSFAMQAF